MVAEKNEKHWFWGTFVPQHGLLRVNNTLRFNKKYQTKWKGNIVLPNVTVVESFIKRIYLECDRWSNEKLKLIFKFSGGNKFELKSAT